MNIILLTLAKIRDEKQTDIYSSLMREFAKHGHEIHIICPTERREKDIQKCYDYENVHIHFAKIGNYYNTPWIEKGVTTVLLQTQYCRTIKKELKNISFDLIMYATPPVTFAKVVRYLKNNNNAKSLLLLKDIWPQSMVDMGNITVGGLLGIVYRYFKKKEEQMYQLSDYIGCMSPACVSYLLEKNPDIPKEKALLCPNALNFDDEWNHLSLSEEEKRAIRNKYGIPDESVVFVFGGNIGNGHDPDFLEECIRLNEKKGNSFILFIGRGLYYERIRDTIRREKISNSAIIPYLPQHEYLKLLVACDVGMITLDHRFTCPNYPSRILSYLVDKKPIIIAQDAVSDIGEIAEKNGYGYWCLSTNPTKFVSIMDRFMNPEERKRMGEKGYDYLKNNYNTRIVYETIIQNINGRI